MANFITRTELARRLRNFAGSNFVTLVAVTDRGKGVTKAQKLTGLIGNDYEKSVRKDTGDDGFVAQKRLWGTRIGSLIEHVKKGESLTRHYIRMRKGKGENTRYFWDGEERSWQWLADRGLVKQRAAGPHNVEMRNIELCNVKQISMGGENLIVVD